MPNPDSEQAAKPIDRITGSYTPSPLPFDSPDGSSLSTPRTLSVLPEPLCRRGPCRHYHEIEVEVDEAEPLAGALESHAVQTHASCYVQPGVETELSLDAPVIRCNRWTPMTAWERGQRQDAIDRFEKEESARQTPTSLSDEDIEDILGTEPKDISPEGDATP